MDKPEIKKKPLSKVLADKQVAYILQKIIGEVPYEEIDYDTMTRVSDAFINTTSTPPKTILETPKSRGVKKWEHQWAHNYLYTCLTNGIEFTIDQFILHLV